MGSRPLPENQPQHESLTRREREILDCLAKNLTNREIAEALTLAESSVKGYTQHIYNKLGVNGRREAVQRARELGLLEILNSKCSEPNKQLTSTQLLTGSGLPTGTVTFLFTDIVDSTPLWEKHPQQMAEALQIHNTALSQVIEANGGTVFKIVGDSFQAAFPTAPSALRAAVDGQRALQSAAWNELGQLKVRVGLHTGEAELDPSGDEFTVSHTKNRVARIMSAAFAGQILLSQETTDLVVRSLPEGVWLKDLGDHRLKGMVQLEHLFQAVTPDLPSDFPPLATRVEHPHNLPVRLTSFIGRRSEIETICDYLLQSDTRLLTITGVGGMGKTSLALQVGWKLLELFKDGVFFVDLTTIKDANLVINTVAQALSIHELPGRTLHEVLAEHLDHRKLLLIVDNFEHVLPASQELVSLMQVAPQLKMLVTSREPLHVSPERLYNLAPLPLPDSHESLTILQENEAISLFVERAQAIRPGFQVTKENAADIATICRQLEGLPLAIELIVARLRLFTPNQLLKQLSDRLRLLSGGLRDQPGRHQTMHSAIAWSYNLLSEDEKKLFSRLSVFPGNFDLEAAVAVCGKDGLEVYSGMESLLDKNLVNRREYPAGLRFWLFETLREYALEQLEASRELDGILHNHAMYYAQFYNDHRGQDYSLWDLERHNLRNALNWAIENQDVEIIFKIGYIFFAWEKQVGEGRHLIARALALPNIQAHTAQRHDLLYSASALAIFARDFEAAREYIHEFGIIGLELRYNVFKQPWFYSFISAGLGDYEEAIDFLIESGLDKDDEFGAAIYLMMLAAYTLQIHDFSTAKEYATKAQDQFNQLWHPNPYVVDCLSILGYVTLEENMPESALQHLSQAFQLALECSVQERLGSIYMGLGGAAMQTGDLISAVTWMSLAETIMKATGYVSRIMIDNIQERYLKGLKAKLSPQDFKPIWETAQGLTMEQAIAYGKERLG